MDAFAQVAAELAALGIPTKTDEPMARHTTFFIGGPAAVFCTPQSPRQLADALRVARKHGLPHRCLGRGSNVLFRDEGYKGVIIHIGRELGAVTVDGTRLTAGTGAALAQVCEAARDASLAGLAFAYGIPGSVGGAVYMNAGAYGGEVKSVLHSVSLLDEDLNEVSLPVAELGLGYRESVFQKKPWVALSATFALHPGDKSAVGAEMEAHMAARRDKQPLDLPSAGSAFKRPNGAFAGALIDQCGLRGYRVGGAAISEKHCGFIVNLGGATCADVLALADHVAGTVKAQTGYVLEKEIRVVTEG